MTTELTTIVGSLEAIAPTALAATWDNVGLLVEPSRSIEPVARCLLTIDLTSSVMQEAIDAGSQLVIAYHPVLFGGAKRLTQADVQSRVLLSAIEHGISIYSPHTALDAVVGGVNDWLIDLLGSTEDRRALEPANEAPTPTGMGRWARLTEPADVSTVLDRIKAGLSLKHLRVAHGDGRLIRTVAVCPGAGGSLLASLRGVDLVLTGEMRHHDVRGLVERGTTVVLTEHTNCERGYLTVLAERLRGEHPEVDWLVSTADRDPLAVR